MKFHRSGGDEMDELMQKLQSVLSDEESMNQIRNLASMFGGGESENTSAPNQAHTDAQNNSSEHSSDSNQSGINMDDISKLLSSISEGNNQSNKNPSNAPAQENQNILSGLLNSGGQNQQNSSQMPFDVGKMMALGNVISNASKPDKNTELLLALKPHLKSEKQDKVDKVIKIFKLISIWPAIRDSGLLGGDLFGFL